MSSYLLLCIEAVDEICPAELRLGRKGLLEATWYFLTPVGSIISGRVLSSSIEISRGIDKSESTYIERACDGRQSEKGEDDAGKENMEHCVWPDLRLPKKL